MCQLRKHQTAHHHLTREKPTASKDVVNMKTLIITSNISNNNDNDNNDNDNEDVTINMATITKYITYEYNYG